MPPNQYGIFYRQTKRLQRVATLWDAENRFVGTATLTDWSFTPELASGASCPPASSLPAAGAEPETVLCDLPR